MVEAVLIGSTAPLGYAASSLDLLVLLKPPPFWPAEKRGSFDAGTEGVTRSPYGLILATKKERRH
jgi:hypothetical protein